MTTMMRRLCTALVASLLLGAMLLGTPVATAAPAEQDCPFPQQEVVGQFYGREYRSDPLSDSVMIDVDECGKIHLSWSIGATGYMPRYTITERLSNGLLMAQVDEMGTDPVRTGLDGKRVMGLKAVSADTIIVVTPRDAPLPNKQYVLSRV